MLASLLLATAVALPPVIADPRLGPSPWRVVDAAEAATVAGEAGVFLTLPAIVDQAWLETAVALGGRPTPLVLLAPSPPEERLLAYFDAVALDPPPALEALPELQAQLAGLPLVVPAADGAGAVAALAGGAAAVLIAQPPPSWADEMAALLPEPVAAIAGEVSLPTAMRAADLATVVGLPAGFSGSISLPGSWYERAMLLAGEDRVELPLVGVGAESVAVMVPATAGPAVLVALRPAEAVQTIATLDVRGARLPSAAEILARHHRAAAGQARLVGSWRAEQRLLVRVWIAELSRSFEVVFAGPAFWQRGVGTDWEISRAWVDGVAWDPDDLPDLPLLEPERPQVPPLALRLEPRYAYALRGVEPRDGRRAYALTFASRPGAEGSRTGTAWIDAETFTLVALEESATDLPGDVRSTRSVTSYAQLEIGGEVVSFPASVVADDLLAAFGGTATVRRALALSELILEPAGFAAERAAAWARDHRMLRDTDDGVVPLVPDGRGGRIAGGERVPSQRFLVGGVFYDPGLEFPLPFGGLQIQDFRFRGRDEQLRALLAGVVNDAAWSKRIGGAEVSLRAFTQLIRFSSTLEVAGEEQRGEELRSSRQRIGGGVARTLGRFRLQLDAGVDRLDFSRTDKTAADFRTPTDTFEGVLRLGADATLAGTTVTLTGEGGWRRDWAEWGFGEEARERWQRGRLLAVWERTPFPLARLHLDVELAAGRDLDRFSAFTPGRFAGVRLRGIASGAFTADRFAAVRGSFAMPLSPRARIEVGVDAAWVRDRRAGFDARPFSGVGLGLTAPGPWGTLLQAAIGVPVTTTGSHTPTLELLLLRPLARRR